MPGYIPDGMDQAQLRSEQSLATNPIGNPELPELTGREDDKLNSSDKEDIQTLFNNLANVIAECADQKDRIDVIFKTVNFVSEKLSTH
jgi:hypothetical protein